MSAYEPGQVAVATVRGVPNVRVMRSAAFPDAPWHSARPLGSWGSYHPEHDVTDVRPLVVLDLDERTIKLLRSSLSRWMDWTSLAVEQGATGTLLDQIEAQTKPPRIPEPGLWGVVEDSAGDVWICTEPHRWTRIVDGVEWPWVDLVDPVLIREGVES